MSIQGNYPDLLAINRQLKDQPNYINTVMHANAPHGITHFRDPQRKENQELIKEKSEISVGDYAYAGNAIGYVSAVNTSGEPAEVDNVEVKFDSRYLPAGYTADELSNDDLTRTIRVVFESTESDGDNSTFNAVDALVGMEVVFIKNSAE